MKHSQIHDRFKSRRGYKNRRVESAIRPGGWLNRLIRCSQGTLWFYTLHAEHLNLHPDFKAPAAFFHPIYVDLWFETLRQALNGNAAYAWLEIGELNNQTHLHIIAEKYALLPELNRGGEVVKLAHNPIGLIKYACKPIPLSAEFEYRKARMKLASWGRRNLPYTARALNIPSNQILLERGV